MGSSMSGISKVEMKDSKGVDLLRIRQKRRVENGFQNGFWDIGGFDS